MRKRSQSIQRPKRLSSDSAGERPSGGLDGLPRLEESANQVANQALLDEILKVSRQMGVSKDIRREGDVDVFELADKWQCDHETARKRMKMLSKAGKFIYVVVRDVPRERVIGVLREKD